MYTYYNIHVLYNLVDTLKRSRVLIYNIIEVVKIEHLRISRRIEGEPLVPKSGSKSALNPESALIIFYIKLKVHKVI